MSALSSQASAASTSASSDAECTPSGRSSRTPTARPSSPATSPTPGASTTSEMSEPTALTKSTSSAAGHPANPPATPAPGSQRTTSDGSGPSSSESWASFDPTTPSWRTRQLSLDGGWESFSGAWPRSGMTRSGLAFPLPTWERPTSGNGSGLWPTPVRQDAAGARNLTARRPKGNGRHHSGKTMLDALILSGDAEMPPTGRWPTPTKSDALGGPGSSGRDGGDNLRTAIRGRPNPTWLEWLMGFPMGHTELPPSATPLSPRSQSGSADGSSSSRKGA